MKTDKKTMDLIRLVKQQKADIARAEKPAYKTNCSFTYIEGKMSDAINLHVEANLKNLISMAAFLFERQANYALAVNTLGVDSAPEFTWNGYAMQEWLDDLKMRINKIQVAAKKKKLETLEARLNAIVSPELRAQLELEAIESELG